jgi:pimeloyl-ACP methyl ester carboxylesterase
MKTKTTLLLLIAMCWNNGNAQDVILPSEQILLDNSSLQNLAKATTTTTTNNTSRDILRSRYSRNEGIPTPSEIKPPDKPVLLYPVLFVHGWNSSPEGWGFSVGDDYPDKDNASIHNSFTNVIKYFVPGEKFNNETRGFTAFTLANYYGLSLNNLNHNMLECFNASNRYAHVASILDPQDEITPIAEELYNRIIEVLNKYYGSNWQNNQDSKIVLVCHSQGGLLTKLLFNTKKENSLSNPMAHIERVISLGSPFRGSPWAVDDPTSVEWPWDILRPAEITLGVASFKGALGPYRYLTSAGVKFSCQRENLWCISAGNFHWCATKITCLDIAIAPEWIMIDPLYQVRYKLEQMISSSVNFNPNSAFVNSVKSSYATNPVSGKIQPWIFIRFRRSSAINSFLATYGAIEVLRGIIPLPPTTTEIKVQVAAADIASRLAAINEVSDLVVPWNSQTLYDIYPSDAQEQSVFEIFVENKAWHSEEMNQADVIIQALDKVIPSEKQSVSEIARATKIAKDY